MSRILFGCLWLVAALGSVASAEGPGTLFLWSSGSEVGGPPRLDEPLASDRPDFTEASSTVGRGVSQLEMGYTYFYDDGAGTRTQAHSYPETLLRQGFLADWLELRVGWNYGTETAAVSLPPSNTRIAGSQDLYLGLKFGLTQQQGFL